MGLRAVSGCGVCGGGTNGCSVVFCGGNGCDGGDTGCNGEVDVIVGVTEAVRNGECDDSDGEVDLGEGDYTSGQRRLL